MIHPQQTSGMPFQKYQPFHEQIPFELPDRTWPAKRIDKAPLQDAAHGPFMNFAEQDDERLVFGYA